MKLCPYCAEEIQDAAVLCRFCQRELAPPAVTPTDAVQDARPRTRRYPWSVVMVCALALAAGFVVGAVNFVVPATRLKVFVTLGVDGAMQLTNETDVGWEACEVAIEGDFVAPLVAVLYPRGTIRFDASDFQRDGTAVSAREAFWRAKQRTEITCAGRGGLRQRAVVSFP